MVGRIALSVLALVGSSSAAAQSASPSLQQEITLPNLRETTFEWSVVGTISAGERSAPDDWLLLEKNAISATLTLKQPIAAGFYASATGQTALNPGIIASSNLEGASSSAELRVGKTIKLGRDANFDDAFDIFAAYQLRSSYEAPSAPNDFFHDRLFIGGISFENVLSIVCRVNDNGQCLEPRDLNGRAGWRFKASASYTNVNSDVTSRNREVVGAVADLGMHLGLPFPILLSGSYENSAYESQLSDAGGLRQDRTVSGFVGTDLTHLIPVRLKPFRAASLGFRYTDTNSNIATKTGDSYLLQLTLGIGSRQPAFPRLTP